MSENIGKSISKSLSGRYSPGMLVMRAKKSCKKIYGRCT